MKFLILLLVTFMGQLASAAAGAGVQVPENCIGKASPCLVRANTDNFQYQLFGYQFLLIKNSILKITNSEEKFEVEILTGKFLMARKSAKPLPFYFAGEQLKVENTKYFVKNKQEVKVLDNADFFITTYVAKPNGLEKKSHEISSKKELIENTRVFFTDMATYKKYLVLYAPRWKKSFFEETKRQTKVLSRSVASVEKAEEEKRQRLKAKAESAKKIKNEFFYRTFER